MPGFLSGRRNQLLIGGFILLLVLLLLLGGAFLVVTRPNNGVRVTSSQLDASPSPDISPSPSPPAAPSPRPSAAPPANPTITAANAILRAGPAPDDTAASNWGANNGGPGCTIWVHAGWTQDGCDIVVIGGDTEHSMAWVLEHKMAGGTTTRRVSVLKGTAGAWVTALYYTDDSGGVTAIYAKTADITGDGSPEITVGYRYPGTQPLLRLDGVRRVGTGSPTVVLHRQLTRGRAVISGGKLTDYSANPDTTYVKTVITYSAGAFHGVVSTVPSAPAGDFA
jgi:hypothetical protein